MDFFGQYTPDQVIVSFKGYDIFGFMDGTFIDIEREEDGFTKHVGARGDVTRTQNMNRSGKITITLMMGSPSNDVLSLFYNDDEKDRDQVGPFLLKDLSGTTRVQATDAWIMKLPKIERAKEAGSVQWVFECAELVVRAGGLLP